MPRRGGVTPYKWWLCASVSSSVEWCNNSTYLWVLGEGETLLGAGSGVEQVRRSVGSLIIWEGSAVGQGPVWANSSLWMRLWIYLAGGGLPFPQDRRSHRGVPGNGLFSLTAISVRLSTLVQVLADGQGWHSRETVCLGLCRGNTMKKTKQDLLTQKSFPLIEKKALLLLNKH